MELRGCREHDLLTEDRARTGWPISLIGNLIAFRRDVLRYYSTADVTSAMSCGSALGQWSSTS